MYSPLMDHFAFRSSIEVPTDLRTIEDLENAYINEHRSSSWSTHTLCEPQKEQQQQFEPEKARNEGLLWKPSRSELLVMITLGVSSLVVALDATILVSVLPTLAIELNGTAAEAFWTGTSYLLTHAVLQPFLAAVSDIFGRREVLVLSIIFFAVGSLVCATAHNFTALLIGRVIQGIGGGGIIALSQVIFADIVPLRQRPKYFAIVLGAWAIGSVLGPLIGGAFVQRSTWRWCFYLNLPITAISLPMAIFFVKLTTLKESLLTKLALVDWAGGVLFIGSLTSALVGISWGGVQYAWSSWRTLVPLILGIFILIFSIVYEKYVAKNPFLNRRIFNTLSANASFTTAAIQGLVLYMALYYVTFYFTSTHFYSPIRSGVSILPASLLVLPGSVIVSALITRFAHFRWAIWIGFAISILATGLFIGLLTERTATAVWAVLLSLFGLGMGMILSSVNVSVQAIVDAEDAGAAAAAYAFMRSVGMTLGVAIGGTVFQNLLMNRLVDLGLNTSEATDVARNSEAFVAQLEAMAPDDPTRRLIVEGYVSGFRGVWIVMCAVCGAGLLVSAFIKKGNLDQLLPSDHRKVETSNGNT